MSLKNKPALIVMNPNEYNQWLRHYPFMLGSDRRDGSCNTLDNPSCRIWVLNKTEGASLNVLNMITRRNDAKSYTYVHASISKLCLQFPCP